MNTCKYATTSENVKNIDLDILPQIEYVFEHFGFIPKWLNISTY